VFHVELGQVAKTALANAQKLKRYISKAFVPPLHKTRFEEAGFDYYDKAGGDDWEACQGLLLSGVNFISKHSADLLANLNMPVAFENDFKNGKNAFFDKHQQFLDSEETARIATETRQLACNEVYTNCMSMCLDGQEIFKNSDAIRKQFVFDEILFLVSGTGTAGFKGTAKDAVTGLPLAGVLFTLKGSDKTALSDADGKFSIIQLAANDWEGVATKPDYQDKPFTQKVIVGKTSTMNIGLVPA
jgi:hypothetical protein